MALDVTTEIAIRRDVGEVSAYAADPANAPDWYANIESVQWETPPPVRVGSRMAFVARFLGRRLSYTYEVMDYVPGSRLVMRTQEGPFPMETTYTWSPDAGGGTWMTLRNRGQPAGFSRWLAPFLGIAVRRANQQDLTRLKRRLESTGRLRSGP